MLQQFYQSVNMGDKLLVRISADEVLFYLY